MNKDRILVVDDSAVMRTLIASKLMEEGMDVSEATDGNHALEKLSSESFDMVVMDVVMPDIDGLEMLGRIRENYPASQLPIIMVTAVDDTDKLVHALKLGASDYVTKPISFPVLLARINTHLQLKHEIQRRVVVESQLGQNS